MPGTVVPVFSPMNLVTTCLFNVAPHVPLVPYTPEELEERTKGQAVNGEWHCTHYARVTASISEDIYATFNCAHNNTQAKRDTCRKHARKILILGNDEPYTDLSSLPQIRWGVDHELQALSTFIETFMYPDEDRVVAADCGLFVHRQHPWLACSPDALLHEWDPYLKKWEHTLLEVKCPYILRDMGREALENLPNSYFVYKKTLHRWELNMKHKMARQYYRQIQVSLAILGLTWAKLLVWTKNTLINVQIKRQSQVDEDHMIARKKNKGRILSGMLRKFGHNTINNLMK